MSAQVTLRRTQVQSTKIGGFLVLAAIQVRLLLHIQNFLCSRYFLFFDQSPKQSLISRDKRDNMHSTLALSVVPFLLSLTHATNIPITVGADAELAFNPQVITASVGDTLTFSYFPKNHSVTQSSFTDPCHPLADGFFSGFQPLAAGPGPVEFVVTVNDTKPIWIYCSQPSHCQKGMAMVVNQP